MRYVFSDYELNISRYELRCHDKLVPLGPKVFDLIAYLVCHRDRAVTKQELFDYLWPGQFVSDAALARCIAAVRKAVRDDGCTQQVIKTLYGRSYRFIATVKEHTHDPPDYATPAASLLATDDAQQTPGVLAHPCKVMLDALS